MENLSQELHAFWSSGSIAMGRMTAVKNVNTLNQLSTQELDEILRDELRKPLVDGDKVREIIRVLEEREKDNPVEMTTQAQAVLDRFQAQEQRRTKRRKPTARSWVIRVLPMAAVLCLILLAVVPQPAKAESWWERFARWTDGIFAFVNNGEADGEQPQYVFHTDNQGLQQVYDAVTGLGITQPVVPMWIPEGYELKTLEQKPTMENVNVIAIFSNGEKELVFRVFILVGDTANKYQKDKTDVVEFEFGEITHNIMRNADMWSVVWRNQNVECVLLADCEKDALQKVIRSVYATEDYL